MTARAPGEGRYAHLEREQRWLLDALPHGVTGPPTDIYDRYILGTRMRLRRATSDGTTVHKLGQKVRVDAALPERVKLTNIYLTEDEYEILAALPAAVLHKQRWHLRYEGRDVAIDVSTEPQLVLAEVELSADEPRLTLPPFAGLDVTDDDRYSGGALARSPSEA